jgi:hypothetical protein
MRQIEEIHLICSFGELKREKGRWTLDISLAACPYVNGS